jgi:hypothetical protein
MMKIRFHHTRFGLYKTIFSGRPEIIFHMVQKDLTISKINKLITNVKIRH